MKLTNVGGDETAEALLCCLLSCFSNKSSGYNCITRIMRSCVGPTVFRRPWNFEPSRGIWVSAVFEPRNHRGITAEFVFLPHNLTFFIGTAIFSQKMTSK